MTLFSKRESKHGATVESFKRNASFWRIIFRNWWNFAKKKEREKRQSIHERIGSIWRMELNILVLFLLFARARRAKLPQLINSTRFHFRTRGNLAFRSIISFPLPSNVYVHISTVKRAVNFPKRSDTMPATMWIFDNAARLCVRSVYEYQR